MSLENVNRLSSSQIPLNNALTCGFADDNRVSVWTKGGADRCAIAVIEALQQFSRCYIPHVDVPIRAAVVHCKKHLAVRTECGLGHSRLAVKRLYQLADFKVPDLNGAVLGDDAYPVAGDGNRYELILFDIQALRGRRHHGARTGPPGIPQDRGSVAGRG